MKVKTITILAVVMILAGCTAFKGTQNHLQKSPCACGALNGADNG